MSLLAIGSVKGSPGATTLSVAVTACWPSERPAVLVEADPAGGDLGARFGLAAEPGLVTLASATRRAPAADSLLAHAQELPGGLPVVVGPASAKQARAALTMLVPAVTSTWSALNTDVIVDCGRLDPSSPVLDVLAHANLALVVARPELADLHHLAARIADLRSRGRSLAVLLAGKGPYGPDEVREAVDADVIRAIPWDPTGAAFVSGRAGSQRGLTRAPLMRAARNLATVLVDVLGADVPFPEVAAAASGNGCRPKVDAK